MRYGQQRQAGAWQRACHDCDLLLAGALAPPGQKLVCPRCNATLHRHAKSSLQYTAALSITGLLLFIPSASLPLLRFSIFAFGAENTLFNGVISLYESSYIWLATLVLFCSVVAPMTKFSLLAFVSLGSAWAFLDRPVAAAVRWYLHFKEWGMLDVYMLGVLVALVKMGDLGKMEVEPGLYCFAAMMLVASLTTLSFDPHAVWARIERRRQHKRQAAAGERS